MLTGSTGPLTIVSAAVQCAAFGCGVTGTTQFLCGVRGVFVHQTITIVVFTIADFNAGSFGLCITLCGGTVGLANQLSGVFTLAFASFAGLTKVEAVVDDTIAIVVFAIAGFSLDRFRFDTAFGAGFVAFANHLASVFALAFADCTGCADIERLVYLAVTVVVLVVTKLR